MASVVTEPNGRRLIQLSPGEDPGRRKVRLGKVSKKDAATACVHVEKLIGAKASGGAVDLATSEWVGGLPPFVRKRLEQLGLIEPQERRECPTLAEWLAGYIRGRADVKPNTRANYERTQASLIAFFGDAKRLDEITAGDAEDFRVYLRTKAKKGRSGKRTGLGKATWNRRLKRAKQFFAAAVKRKLIPESPFEDIKTRNVANRERDYFVTQAEAEAVLGACADVEWRLIFALCRYGGLRCPTEVLRLRWADIDWEQDRFVVHADKTAGADDGGIRVPPIFPELRPHLQDAFDAAEDGAEYVITRYRDTRANLRTQLRRIIKRAGLVPWPKTFANLRATRRTELEERFPGHVLDKWFGHSEAVARKHYLQITPEHYAKAVQNAVHDPVQNGAAGDTQGIATDAGGELVGAGATSASGWDCGDLRSDANACGAKTTQLLGRQEVARTPPRGVEPLSPG